MHLGIINAAWRYRPGKAKVVLESLEYSNYWTCPHALDPRALHILAEWEAMASDTGTLELSPERAEALLSVPFVPFPYSDGRSGDFGSVPLSFR